MEVIRNEIKTIGKMNITIECNGLATILSAINEQTQNTEVINKDILEMSVHADH